MTVSVKEKKYHLDEFKFYDFHLNKFIDSNTNFNKKIKDFNINLLYECKYLNCSDYDERLEEFKNDNITRYNILINYDYFYLDHQNSDKPIIKDENHYFGKYFYFNTSTSSSLTFNWKNIIYREKKGFFQSNYEDNCGYIESDETFSYNRLNILVVDDINKSYDLCEISFKVDNTQYTEYFRKRISELDIIANILSLIANIFSIFFGFYSNSFINYKIVENILNKNNPKRNKFKIDKSSEMNDLENNKFISINDDFNEKCLDKNENIDNKNNNNDNSDNFEEEKENSEESNKNIQNIKKLHFYEFFLNNIYSLCKKKKNQNLIQLCNKIVYKYASIDSLVNNQILIENFFKDYKWNQPCLNDIKNNNLIIQLKTYL